MDTASMGIPGIIPTVLSRNGAIDPTVIFGSASEKEKYRRLLEGQAKRDNIAPDVRFKKVVVKIFDLSDQKQVEEYEKLWLELLEKTARMEVSVESRKDLVHRKDGTSYWMKYVEYVEFGNSKDLENEKDMSGKSKEEQ